MTDKEKQNNSKPPKFASAGHIPFPSQRMKEETPRAKAEPVPPSPLPIRTLRCPKCNDIFERNCKGLMEPVICKECGTTFPYVDGYLSYYKEYIELFIDPIHTIPMVPGYSTSGRVMSVPDDLLVVDFGIKYQKSPEVFFLVPGEKSARQWISENQVLMPISVSDENFILFSRSIVRSLPAKPTPVTWMAIGETDSWDKPLWLNYLQNAAHLVREEEDIAAIVMLMIAIDFFYDHVLERIGIGYDVIRREGRRPGMNEKKAKLKMIAERLGDWPEGLKRGLTDLTDFRNRIVHGVVKRPTTHSYSGRRAFQITMRAVLFLIELFYSPSVKHTEPEPE